MALVIRPFRPGDEFAAARIHMRAFPGFFLSSLGEAFMARYIAAQARDPHGFVALAWEDTDSPSPRCLGYMVGNAKPDGMNKRLLLADAWGMGWAALPTLLTNPAKIRDLWLRLRSHRDDPPPTVPPSSPSSPSTNPGSAALLVLIGTDPEARGRGAGRALMDHFSQEAQRHGATRVYCSTDADDNDATLRFYAQAGYQPLREHVTEQGRRMVILGRPLSDG